MLQMLTLALKLCERYNATIIQQNNTADKHFAGSNSKQTSLVLNIRDQKLLLFCLAMILLV